LNIILKAGVNYLNFLKYFDSMHDTQKLFWLAPFFFNNAKILENNTEQRISALHSSRYIHNYQPHLVRIVPIFTL